jgi:hypothetical protein
MTGAGERVDDDERDEDGIDLLSNGTGSSSTRKLSGSWRRFLEVDSELSVDGRFCGAEPGLCAGADLPLLLFGTCESIRTTPSLSRASCIARSRFKRLSSEI